MLRAKLSVVCAAMLTTMATLLAGCSSAPVDKTAGMSPNRLYAEAKDEMGASQWDKAVPLLEKLEARAAGTPLAQQAQLDKAYAQFKAGEQAQSLATLERFIKLHPASPALDYAIYLRGIVNFNDDLGLLSSITRQDLAERDQKAAKESFESFKELTTRFPESKYAPDAQQRMNYIVGSLAQYEVHVAKYYYKRGAYLAAANRAQQCITDYRDVPAIEEALFILYKSYDALGMEQLRDDAKRVLEKNFPQSDFLLKGGKANSDPWWKIW
ncbi:outer membrane protein assembly factor BamD [Rhodoferax mekongensis]|uniref:outer membrane protein assembly factor BamD n=1 Tax=Rhodoferax mekongensis TaxID=3068341 RepID=UPI0028BD1FAC|nr:outer membrane protein assembly factor BamD [Rhodoferax sp. TBRC 17199]MDT7515704.1 outer membrane protein assembly factor BamD [Rhodoferax sp. TBRC 17199]NBX20560.1 outer membrane protein assembly factor BamD [Betaproteobacteria bacterium]